MTRQKVTCQRSGELHPDSPVLEEGEQRLQEAKQARADRLAEQERQRQAELERQRIAQAVESQWQLFEQALGEENPVQAEEILRQVRALNPDGTRLAQGEQRLKALRAEQERQRAEAIQAHWVAFEAAIQAEDLDEATGILAEIRGLHPEEPGLPEGKQRLVEAQAALERQRIEQTIQEYWAAFETALSEEDFEAAADSLAQIHGLDSEASVLIEGERRLAEARRALERELAGEMVEIPSGTFRMGGGSWKPVHSVSVPAFRMGKYEVTFAQWDTCVADGGCDGYRPDDKGWGRGDQPVIYVSWDDAQSFIEWLNSKTGGNFRLPTEAEWEYAVRAGSSTIYSWGDHFDNKRANSGGLLIGWFR